MRLPARQSTDFFTWTLPRCTALLLGAGATLLLTVSQAQEATTLKTLYSFPNDNSVYGSYNGPGPQSLVRGKDGSIYGTTGQGGSSLYGTIFKLSSTGQPVTIYTFTGGNDGGVPNPELAQDDDGNFYGTTTQNGANNAGTVFKVSPTGIFTLVHTVTSQDTYIRSNGLVRGSDGNLYGGAGNGVLYRVTPAGTYAPVENFDYTLSTGLSLGHDGNLYGLGRKASPPYGGTTVVQISPSGTVRSFGTVPNQSNDIATLIQGSDGNFYGTLGGAGFGRNGGSVFRVAADGTYTLLHQFDDPNEGIITSICKLLEGSDGNFYGAATGSTTANTPEGIAEQDTLYQITPGGAFTVLYTFHGSDGTLPQVVGGVNAGAGAALLAGPNGSFYGTTIRGGTDDYGTIFQATLRPSFFAGAATLDNDVYYLAFPSGNAFGYFSFLSEPDYLYHFDLGYEYVFNANDGRSGVYLYDFKSGGFFYTSPSFPFPFLYDFALNTVLYYYPDPNNAGHYNTDGTRYFYRFDTGQVISK